MAKVSLDKYSKGIEIEWKGKVYTIPKIKVVEGEIVKTISNMNSVSGILANAPVLMDFIIDRMKKADPEIDEESLRDELTYEEVDVIGAALIGRTAD